MTVIVQVQLHVFASRIASLCCLCMLVRVIAFSFDLRHSTEDHSKSYEIPPGQLALTCTRKKIGALELHFFDTEMTGDPRS